MSRSAWRITWSVWHALLLREAVARMFSRRGAIIWLLMEPVSQIGFMVAMFGLIRATHVGGMDTALWLTSGMLAFFLFRRVATQGAAAIGANLALYTYRQVRPVDTVLVRSWLEGLVMLLTAIIVFAGEALLGVHLQLEDPLLVLNAILGLWLLGLGWGLAASVASELIPEAKEILNLAMMPLMVISGAVFPLAAIPHGWREWVMLNPIAHGIEAVRAGISPYYHHAPEMSLSFLYAWTLVLIFLGLALQARFRSRLISL
jgi:capsular polysaccharide transport system permease protein